MWVAADLDDIEGKGSENLPSVTLSGSPEEVCVGDYGNFGDENGNMMKSRGGINDLGSFSSSSTSSIGKNSDLSGMTSSDSGENSGDGEVQSSYTGSSLDTINALEDVLPMRRGISSFYDGKSKSFTSLVDASSSSSVKDLAKPENPYNKKRRNLFASSLLWERNKSFPLKSNSGGISKKLTNSTRTTLALAVAMSTTDGCRTGENSNLAESSCIVGSPPLRLHRQLRQSHTFKLSSSPLSSPRFKFSCRSFSLADLQKCASVAATDAGRNESYNH